MPATRTAPNAPGTFVCAALAALATGSCSDTQTPYQAYLACDEDIAAAESLAAVSSCYTEQRQQWLRAQLRDDDGWFRRFTDERPVISRLHEEQRTDVENESILQIVGYTSAGQPAAIEVRMRREGRRWKIDYEDALAKGAAGSAEKPLRVSLRAVDGAEWYPGELAASAGRRRAGGCQLSIIHVFRFPEIRIMSDCERLATPGTYRLDEFAFGGGERSDVIPVVFYDATHAWFGVESGELTITGADDGLISGEFRFETSNPSQRLSVSGAFSNLPFNPGG